MADWLTTVVLPIHWPVRTSETLCHFFGVTVGFGSIGPRNCQVGFASCWQRSEPKSMAGGTSAGYNTPSRLLLYHTLLRAHRFTGVSLLHALSFFNIRTMQSLCLLCARALVSVCGAWASMQECLSSVDIIFSMHSYNVFNRMKEEIFSLLRILMSVLKMLNKTLLKQCVYEQGAVVKG
jgi:hypothetical protein